MDTNLAPWAYGIAKVLGFLHPFPLLDSLLLPGASQLTPQCWQNIASNHFLWTWDSFVCLSVLIFFNLFFKWLFCCIWSWNLKSWKIVIFSFQSHLLWPSEKNYNFLSIFSFWTLTTIFPERVYVSHPPGAQGILSVWKIRSIWSIYFLKIFSLF